MRSEIFLRLRCFEVLDPRDAVAAALHNIFQFKGRASRSEFWWFILFVNFVVAFIFFVNGVLPFGALSSLAIILTIAISVIPISVRRLHDVGRTGWNLLLVFQPYLTILIAGEMGPILVPIVERLPVFNYLLIIAFPFGPLVLLYWFCKWGEKFTNDYGDDPVIQEEI